MASFVIVQLLSDLPVGWAECLPSSSFCARPRTVGRGFDAAAAPPSHETDGPSALPSQLAVAAGAVLSVLVVVGLALSRRRLAASELDELEASTTPGAAPYIGSGKKTKKTKRRADTTPRSKDVKSTPCSTPQTPSSHAAQAVQPGATITKKLLVPQTPNGEPPCAEEEGAREVTGRAEAARQVDATAAPASAAAPTPPLALPVDAPAVAKLVPMPQPTLAQHGEHGADAAQPEPPAATSGPPQGAGPAGAGSSAQDEAALDVAGPPVPVAQPATPASPVAPNASHTFVDGAILSLRLAASSEPAPAAASTGFRLEERPQRNSSTTSEPAASASKPGLTSRNAFSSMSSEGSGECSPAPSSPSQETPDTTPTLKLRAERSNLPWQGGSTGSVTEAPPEACEEATKESGAHKEAEAPPLPEVPQTLALRRQNSSGRKSFKMLNTNLSIVTPAGAETSPAALRIIPLAPPAPPAEPLKPHQPAQPAVPAGPPAKPAEEQAESYRSSINSCDNSGESTDHSGEGNGSPYGDQANPAAAAFAPVPCVPPVPRVPCDDETSSAPSTPMPPLEPCTPPLSLSERDSRGSYSYSSPPSPSRAACARSPFSALHSPGSRSSPGIPASLRPPSSPAPPGLTPRATTPVSSSPPPGLVPSPTRLLSERRSHVEFKFAPETYVPSQAATPKGAAYGRRAAPRAELGAPSSPWSGNRRRSPRPSPGGRAPWSMPGAYGEAASEARWSDSRGGSTPSTPRHLTLPKKKKNRAAQAARLRTELQQLVDPASPSDKRGRSIRRQTM